MLPSHLAVRCSGERFGCTRSAGGPARDWGMIARSRMSTRWRRGTARLRRFVLLAGLLVGALGIVSARDRRQSATVRRFRAWAETWLAQPENRAHWGVLIVDRDSGQTLYARDADEFFQPASNAKLFTTALALATLGPAYRFRTTLEATGPLDDRGTLHGDLVLVGRGDPTLSNLVFPFRQPPERDGPPERALADLVQQAVRRGLRQVMGDVLADDSYFSAERYPPGWTVDDLTAGYGAAVSALVVADNAIEVEVAPGSAVGEPVTVKLAPWAPFYRFRSEAVTGPPGQALTLQLHREPDRREVVLRGTIPLDASVAHLQLGVEQPAEFAAALLRELLEQQGVAVLGGTGARHRPDVSAATRTVLAEYVSPSLAELVEYVNKVSQNLHAECLLRTVARERAGVGSREKGLEVLGAFLATAGINQGVRLWDGSGLSVYDQVTPQAVVALLRYADRQSWGPLWEASLPVAAQDGTLEKRMVGTPAAGRVRAKTGTLAHVATLSGYATTLGGRRLVFSILVNGIPPEQHFSDRIDRFVEAAVEMLDGVQHRSAGAPTRRPS